MQFVRSGEERGKDDGASVSWRKGCACACRVDAIDGGQIVKTEEMKIF